MYLASEKFKKSITKPNREVRSKAVVNGITLDDSNIVTINIESSLLSGDDFKLGSAISSSFNLVLNNIGGTFNSEELENKEIEIFIGAAVGDNRYRIKEQIEYVRMGIFKIEKAPKQKETITLSGFDRMILFEKEYRSNLTYPVTLLQMALEIANKAGVSLAATDFTNSDYIVKNRPLLEGVTLREAIGYIAELSGGFAKINRLGELEIFSISNTDIKISTTNFYEDFEKGDFNYGPIEQIVIDYFGVKAYRGNGENIFTIKDNPFADNPSELIDGIYNKLNGFMYVPFSTSWQGNPSLDVGDRISINDKVGITYNSIVTNNKITYDNGLKYETKAIAKNKTAKEYKTQGNLTKQVTALKEKVVELKTTDDSIIARVEETEREVNGAGGLKERIQSAELKITAEAIVNTVTTSIKYNNDISTLQSQIIQTSEEISQRVTNGEFESYKTQTAGLISQKVSSGEVYSIIKSSPSAVEYAFNSITPTVVINSGGITINSGSLNSPSIKGGTISSGTLISAGFSGSTNFENCVVSGLERSGYTNTAWVMGNFALKSHSHDYAPLYHGHSEYASSNHYHSEFDGFANNINIIYGLIGDLQRRVSALGG